METEKPSLVELEQEAVSVRSSMTAITITNQDTYNLAVEKRTEAANWLKNAKAFFKGMKDPAYAAWKKICSNENEVCNPVEKTISMINGELVRYDREQERIRQEHQRRLDEEARKEAEEQKLADAIHLENQGVSPETVNAILSEPVPVQAPVMAAPTYQKSSAVVYRDNFKCRITDFHALVKAISKDKTKLPMLVGIGFSGDTYIPGPNLNAQARILKEAMSQAYPGTTSWNDRGIATGRS